MTRIMTGPTRGGTTAPLDAFSIRMSLRRVPRLLRPFLGPPTVTLGILVNGELLPPTKDVVVAFTALQNSAKHDGAFEIFEKAVQTPGLPPERIISVAHADGIVSWKDDETGPRYRFSKAQYVDEIQQAANQLKAWRKRYGAIHVPGDAVAAPAEPAPRAPQRASTRKTIAL
jgi:hypothetical protein